MNTTLAFILAFFCGISSAFAQTNEEAARKIDSLFASYNEKTPGVAVAVVHNGKVVFSKGYGMANLSHNIPITPQTVFNLASVSKQFTAFTIYLLESEGRLSFEDDVRKYIPELPVYEAPIKIKYLLAHISGLRDHGALASIAGEYYLADLRTTEQNLKLLVKQKALNFKPGTAFGYCNSNYTLLAEIVHRITGKTFADYTNEKIFAPLGMKNTQVADTYETVVNNMAESYHRRNGKYFRTPLMESNPGPSNLLTTIEDLSKWVLNFENPVVGNAQLIKAFNEPSYLDNGKKVIVRLIDGDTIFHAKGQNVWKHKGANILSHGGHTAAFRTHLGRFPDQRVSIIQLSNDEDHEDLGGAWDIADYYPNKYVAPQQRVVTTSANAPASTTTASYTLALTAFAGEYANDELETKYRLEVKDNAVIMKHRRLYDIPLKRTGESKFTGFGPNTFAFTMNFVQDQTGAVVGFDISNYGVTNLRFWRRK
ncbi:MAG: beta-lactamase family protein [Candidatus Kapabacteria bacterium]|jgi:CubicO group peptidase (beta-lactamase class C family)|nr:beta-lactamase family protein [Candidatus Kapabacteria bacterium]